jgi:hypothetical protein
MTRRSVCGVLTAALFVAACGEDYRIGEYVSVAWEGRDYPAYVIDHRTKSRYRVHYDGYDTRWDEDVTSDRIKGLVKGPVTPPPPPDKVARAMGIEPKPSGSAGAPSVYSVGDRVRVRWRDSVYAATIVALAGSGQLRVHYDGYGTEWDEVVSEERVLGRR